MTDKCSCCGLTMAEMREQADAEASAMWREMMKPGSPQMIDAYAEFDRESEGRFGRWLRERREAKQRAREAS